MEKLDTLSPAYSRWRYFESLYSNWIRPIEYRKENGCWIISPNWTTDRYATREESRAIHIAVKSYLKALRYAVGTSLLLIRAQKANEPYRAQIDEVLGKLYPEDNQEEW